MFLLESCGVHHVRVAQIFVKLVAITHDEQVETGQDLKYFTPKRVTAVPKHGTRED
jgi:hypothetical protein